MDLDFESGSDLYFVATSSFAAFSNTQNLAALPTYSALSNAQLELRHSVECRKEEPASSSYNFNRSWASTTGGATREKTLLCGKWSRNLYCDQGHAANLMLEVRVKYKPYLHYNRIFQIIYRKQSNNVCSKRGRFLSIFFRFSVFRKLKIAIASWVSSRL